MNAICLSSTSASLQDFVFMLQDKFPAIRERGTLQICGYLGQVLCWFCCIGFRLCLAWPDAFRVDFDTDCQKRTACLHKDVTGMLQGLLFEYIKICASMAVRGRICTCMHIHGYARQHLDMYRCLRCRFLKYRSISEGASHYFPSRRHLNQNVSLVEYSKLE